MVCTIATSWDDGLESDKQLLSVLDRVGVQSSFALTPSRYSARPIPNDIRSIEKYGSLLQRCDLGIYSRHDICNHTANHYEMPRDTRNNQDIWRQEIVDGQDQLEQIFSRQIKGIVWPYGVSTPTVCKFAENCGHLYGRETNTRVKSWLSGKYTCWNLAAAHWKELSIETVLSFPCSHLVVYGHTYEFQTKRDWEQIEEFYTTLSSDFRCRLVTLTDLAEEIKNNEFNGI